MAATDFEIKQMNQIDDYLFLSGYRIAQEVTPDKIQTVVSILHQPFPSAMKKEGIEYYCLIALDFETTDLLTYFPQTNKWITDSIDAKRNTLVHCAAGVSRSATIVCAYIMKKYQFNMEEALDFIRQKRPVNPNQGFRRQLQLFYQMGWTLDANCREFRNFLLDIYFQVEPTDKCITKYYNRMALAKSMTKEAKTGVKKYCCAKCSEPLFDEHSIVQNSPEPEDSNENCADMFIDPQDWMAERLENLCSYTPYGKTRELNLIRIGKLPDSSKLEMKCPKCALRLFTFHRFLSPYPVQCRCPLHKNLEHYLMIKVVPESVKVMDTQEVEHFFDTEEVLELEEDKTFHTRVADDQTESDEGLSSLNVIPDLLDHLVINTSPDKFKDVASD